MFRSVLLPCVLMSIVMFSKQSAFAADTINNPMAGFDITATNQVYGAQFNADFVDSYTMIFEYEITAGNWSQLGSKSVNVTTTGNIDLDVQMGTLEIGTSYNGRVKLFRSGSLKNTKTGTFRGPPAPPGL